MEQLRRVRWLAVGWGLVADVLLTEVVGLVVAGQVGIGPDTSREVAEALLRESGWFWPTFAIGIFFSGIGGYIAARLARREGPFHGTLTAFIANIVLGLFLMSLPSDTVGMAGVMLAILAGTAGGTLAAAEMPKEV